MNDPKLGKTENFRTSIKSSWALIRFFLSEGRGQVGMFSGVGGRDAGVVRLSGDMEGMAMFMPT